MQSKKVSVRELVAFVHNEESIDNRKQSKIILHLKEVKFIENYSNQWMRITNRKYP